MNVRLIGLAAIAVMMTAILMQTSTDAPIQTDGVLPELKVSLDDVTGVRIVDLSGDQTVSLRRADGGWLMASLDNYPADGTTVSQLLLDLSDLAVAERKTARPENHERLGLASNGIELTLEPLGRTIIFGNVGPSGGRFIRFSGEDQTFLTRQSLEVSADSMEWVDSLLLNIPADQIQSIRIARQDGKLLQAERQDQEWQVDGLPSDRELRYPTIVDSLGRLLLDVRILDVVPHDPDLFAEANRLSGTLTDGEVVDVYTVQDGADYWLHTTYNGKGAWQHKISEFTYNELTKELGDLLKEKEEPDRE